MGYSDVFSDAIMNSTLRPWEESMLPVNFIIYIFLTQENCTRNKFHNHGAPSIRCQMSWTTTIFGHDYSRISYRISGVFWENGVTQYHRPFERKITPCSFATIPFVKAILISNLAEYSVVTSVRNIAVPTNAMAYFCRMSTTAKVTLALTNPNERVGRQLHSETIHVRNTWGLYRRFIERFIWFHRLILIFPIPLFINEIVEWVYISDFIGCSLIESWKAPVIDVV